MNIEESIKEIEKIKEIFIHLRNYGWINDIKKDINTDNAIQAIGTLLTAYEKEKEKIQSFEYALSNGEIETVNYFSDIAPTLLINSYTHGKEVLNFIKRNFISKDKIKAKIEEVKDGTYDAKIVLQSLLEKE